jgi:hypothetical protein
MLDVSSSRLLCSNLTFLLSFLDFNFIPFICLYKFSLDKEADMLTCNLSKIVHNIWLQQSGNKGTCIFFATSNDYMQVFKQFSLYYVLL